MEPKLINFFKFLEDKGEQRAPLKVKLLNPEQFEITPEDLKVEGYLDLENTPITSLPDGLEVENGLGLRGSSIISLPKDLKVGGNLYLSYTPLSSKTEAEIRQMAPNVKGEIFGVKKSL